MTGVPTQNNATRSDIATITVDQAPVTCAERPVPASREVRPSRAQPPSALRVRPGSMHETSATLNS
jgi:hypothetical protein